MMIDKTNIFIEKAKKIHKNQLYDYSKVEYIKSNEKVKIGCKIHGFFEQTPGCHLANRGCRLCGYKSKNEKNTMGLTEFIEKAITIFGTRYDYSKVIYIKSHSKVIIGCKIHGFFEMTPNDHIIKKHACKLCGNENSKLKNTCTTQEFIDKSKLIHKNAKYDYTQTIYIKYDIKVKIICEKHGIFETTPKNHIHITRKQGCPKCILIKKYSKPSINWLNFISKLYNIEIQHGENSIEYRIPNTRFSADGFCEQTNTIYEFHGDYWHGNPKIFIHTEINKSTKCTFGELYQRTLDREQLFRDLGYNLITIWENDWKKLNKCVNILQIKYRNSKL